MNAGATRELIGVSRAEHIVRDHMPVLPVETVSLLSATGRILGAPLEADRPYPPFDRVMMDGVALQFERWKRGQREFPIRGIQAAGQAAGKLEDADGCMEVMTGAVLPAGTDCVVPVEDYQVANQTVVLSPEARVSENGFVHRAGSDCPAGSELLAAGARINAPVSALLASEGVSEVKVAARPRIAIVATGDELVTGDRALAPHEIRSSNAPALASALIAHGWGEPSLLHLPDARDELARGLERALEQHDLLIVSGGVSKGRFDYVPEVLEAAGIRARFHGVRQRPGKPMWFGSRRQDQKVVFALPGNPVSALVCMHRYVLPALAHAAGHTGGERSVALAQTEHFTPALTWFLPVRLARNEQGAQMAESRTANTSGDFVGLAHTDGFVELPAGESEFPAGYVARYFSWLPA